MRKIKKPDSLADQAYDLIRKDILTGTLAPNEELREEKFALELGISRTPLREAIRRLATDGLVVLQSGKPAIVSSFTKEDALHHMEVRKLLETYNIEQIAKLTTPDFLKSLKSNLKLQKRAADKNDFHEFIELDREFHLLLADQNPNTKLCEMIYAVNTGVNRAFLILANTYPVSAMEASGEHEDIVNALEQQDGTAAINAMTEHMDNIERRFLHYYEKG
ncbi:GntR family transcriptional regulator [Paenisporosarcina quisquiliarum]|uniref:GntR family transcriptional regulator n=1 Tax=Paenisporosarcina quisquiliarum TaxID=365346 RepID=A0A9X3RDS8_9BACL|nr:GntR family transcriptional regulator [Paenisporosarcina quisquiliarum]MCZ8536658.1 GntR family transcriptional regulator [Paenisporosarcina quisquiliarum]